MQNRPNHSEGAPNPGPPGRLPELLAPAGDWECARAAVENGADAIYFGLEKFNARMRANNFTEADLPQLMEFLHRRGVRGYLTFNILVFEDELAAAEQYVRAMISAGVDAAVVQDVGMVRLIRQHSPDFPIHVSTQMTITSAAGLEFARALGANRVVLARECSLPEIAALRTPPAGLPPLPLEVFIHGALCVAYSGQCLTSEALGGRSANRGECAQACRLPYELVADGQRVALGDRKYLLSPQDLAGLEVLPELVRLGVASLKIEGRLKSPEYVANITRIYRRALDQRGGDGRITRADRYGMEMAFSRGLHTGWFRGTHHQQLVHGRFGKKRGVFLGPVARREGERVWVELQAPLKPGDGVVFDAGCPEQDEQGGRVYDVRRAGRGPENGRLAELRFGRGDLDFRRIHAGDKLWKTSDPELDRALRQSYAGDAPRFQRPLRMEVRGAAGQPLTLIVQDELGHEVRLASAMPLARAQSQPLTTPRLQAQLGRLGGTAFRLDALQNSLAGEVVLPVSELNRLRREAVRQLDARRARPRQWTLRNDAPDAARANAAPPPAPPGAPPHLIVLVRSQAQLDAALHAGVETVYCEWEDLKKYREAVAAARRHAAATGRRVEIFAAPPRIFKAGEEWTLRQVRASEADGYLVRNYDHLRFFARDRCVGDYSLNIANRLAADYFQRQFGLERITASYDLNAAQLAALLRGAPPEWFEITIHQHMPMFHMEHCVFCAFLTSSADYRTCGRPCDTREVKLRDRVGAEHPVKADAGCRNTVFNARAQTGAEYVARLQALGARHFRLEFLDESPAQASRAIALYRQLLRGEISAAQISRELKLLNQLGVTRSPPRL
ncbi:MAG: U32 family peptidase [Verrucomicrobia bacterium]|mgnify:CR=1 FL=1|nr:U32 family peptidase [Verrucomicrobiota bacterium]OQC26848.1 MAG: putative protease YhbU precursor [Verrucomicrobia bacterium ADurb.Bin063]